VSPDRLTLLHFVDDEAAGRAVLLRGARAEELTSALLRALAGDAPLSPAPSGADRGEGRGA